MQKAKKVKPSDAETVAEYMNQLEHPLKPEIETLREMIKGADPRLSERIKWNAPSYYYKHDLLTFNPRTASRVHIVFHNEAIVKVKSPLLEGDYKDRRMMYFKDMKAVEDGKSELQHVLGEYVARVDSKE